MTSNMRNGFRRIMKRTSNRKSGGRAQSGAATSSDLQYETLEPRRVLATGILDGLTGALQVNYSPTDIQVRFGNDGQYVTFAGSADLDSGQAGEQKVLVSDVKSVHFNGVVESSGQSQSAVLSGEFNLENDLQITGLNHTVFDGNYFVGGDLMVDLVDDPGGNPAYAGTTVTNRLVVQGMTDLGVDGNISMFQGEVELRGPVSLANKFSGGTTTVLTPGKALTLQDVDLAGTLRMSGLSISDTADASIVVGQRTYLRGGNITLGETGDDYLDLMWVNFKSGDEVNITDNNFLVLMGRNFANELNVSAMDWIGDGVLASTVISGHASFDAQYVVLGETGADEFRTGTLSIIAPGHARVSANDDVVFSGTTDVGSFSLSAAGNVFSDETASLDIFHNLSIQAEGDIELGVYDTDHFASGTISIAAPDGDVTIHEDDSTHLVDVRNIAKSLELQSKGHITDDVAAGVHVIDKAMFVAMESVVLGESETGSFHSGSLGFDVARDVSITQLEDIMLEGENVAQQLSLTTEGSIRDASNATTGVKARAAFKANSIELGDTPFDRFDSGWINFLANQDVAINEDSDTTISGENSTQNLMIQSAGDLRDMPETVLAVADTANLQAKLISLGNDGQFSSEMLTVNADGNVTINQTGDVMLTGQSWANTLRLRSGGTISNTEGATVRATFRLDLISSEINLGKYDDDMIASSTLRFDSSLDTRLQMNRSVLFVENSSARAIEIVTTGDILDLNDAAVHAELLARLEGVDIVLGDSTTDCFSVTSEAVEVVASGLDMVTLDNCP